LFRIYQRQV